MSANAAEQPSVEELLAQYAATQDRLKSYIVKYETTITSIDASLTGTAYSAGEMRFDGRHVVDRSRLWGHLGPGLVRSQEKPNYQSRLLDDQFLYSYQRGLPSDTDAGTLSLRDAATAVVSLPQITGSPLEFRLSVGRDSKKRIDARLREASVIRVRDKLEPAGAEALPCYVLEADTRHGLYIVWLDPAHGYHMAKAIRRCRFGHLRPNDKPYGQRETILGTLDKVRFEQQGGLWVPMEFTNTIDETDAMGHRWKQTHHFRATRFTLNPDHVALRSFIPDDITDGAVLKDSRGQKLGIWRDGRVVDSSGKVIDYAK